ncbi:phospho-2-dehydro-3-deoxyheptonate aldolase [Capsaspora owczarzaki ATCC 30864]|uniref:Phospho-2-dehydro-3-deoxyheptonate aldolase n=1 Tax=Capsaspora owczarzaki (strain ATCC 30864) TaxID=595528 RepID=A0A0D2WM34_CAPO3|nr:phospho-2-dehydro-3-deoxyheptonate aldolase [Capsaspora owczarzaki ATCC 30864]KJE91825.1 phospho-2-dehydro-3-deoxyheptonate aldolase [Capsaspora owczarzaki ATCC 30864]|eukprot:XP_004363744.2 phospho-2-dehydro-3-deoxyheptonate aldolase [Capsaspora owczarzaki ATCC 30864]
MASGAKREGDPLTGSASDASTKRIRMQGDDSSNNEPTNGSSSSSSSSSIISSLGRAEATPSVYELAGHRALQPNRHSHRQHQQQQQADQQQQQQRVPDGWTPASWKSMPVKQQPTYSDPSQVDTALGRLRSLPPLVHWGEIDRLRKSLADAAEGNCFVMQGGDCAELFQYCNQTQIENKLKILLQMSLVLTWGARTPIVRIARIAGQYGKPRSSPTEVVDGKTVPSFRGDNVNGFELSEREANPDRLVQAYFHSAATLNYVRALVSGGFADLRHPDNWTLEHVRLESTRRMYEDMVGRMLDALHFTKTIGAAESHGLETVDLFVSHEGLLLDYESALTIPVNNQFYNVGTHFLWIGDRTRQLDHGHVEYFRGISNPIGVKVGPSTQPNELVELIRTLNPCEIPGKVSLITRYGCDKIQSSLPAHIAAVQAAGIKVAWICDPMHGNTESTASGLKTRNFDKILKELSLAFEIHQQHGRQLNGVHFELTGDTVTECTGGSVNLVEEDLSRNYQSFCDPRLNYEQSLDMAFLIADFFQRRRGPISRVSSSNDLAALAREAS